MKRHLSMLLIVLFNLLLSSVEAKEIICQLHGRVINRSSQAVFLMKATTDYKSSLLIKIPIDNGVFSYKLVAQAEEAYRLIFEEELAASAYKPVIFFPDSTEVLMTLYSSEEAETKNEIMGGLLNRKYQDHMAALADAYKTFYMTVRQKRNDAVAAKTYYSAAYDSLAHFAVSGTGEQRRLFRNKLSELKKNGKDLSPIGKAIRQEEQYIVEKMFIMRYEYICRNPSPVSYFMLYDDLNYSGRDLPIFTTLAPPAYDILVKALPGHPYNQKAGYLVKALTLEPGQPFIDFQAPDLEGKRYKFSSLVNGKVTLLDLWASWCGPCINKTREVIPIYNRYKGKGFQIVGIAREFKDIQNLKAVLAREKHPWLTLVDLEDENLVWHKYGLSNAGGGMVLLDAQGNILATNPTIAKIEQLLKAKLL